MNERDYGELTGLDKDQARERWGENQVRTWRRSYAEAPPAGESLRDTAARVLPFYISRILPCVMQERSVLVVAHGNSLRALVMALDDLTPQAVEDLEIATGEIIVYELERDTSVGQRAGVARPAAKENPVIKKKDERPKETDHDFYVRALQEEEDAEAGISSPPPETDKVPKQPE